MVDLPIIEDCCRTCHFWQHDEAAVITQPDMVSWCRRYPPAVAPHNQHSLAVTGLADERFEFRQTLETDWCGEYRRLSLQGPRIGMDALDLLESTHEKLEVADITQLSELCVLTGAQLTAAAGLDAAELLSVVVVLGRLGLQLAAEPAQAAAPKPVADTTPLAALHLPIKVHRALYSAELRTVGDLMARDYFQIGSLRNIGAGALAHIRAALQRCGLQLRDDPVESREY